MNKVRMSLLPAWCVLLACVSALAQQPRQVLDLSGHWQLLPADAAEMTLPPGADAPWQSFTAPGMWGDGQHDGAWLSREVDVGPEVYAADVFVRPSVSRKELAVDVELVNRAATERRGRVQAVVAETQGAEVLALPGAEFRLAPGEQRVVTLVGRWETPRLWWPHDPHLYPLKVCLLDTGGRTVDEADARFGFREITVDRHYLLLNGKRLVLWGDSLTRYGSIHRTKEDARRAVRNELDFCRGNALRLHWDPMEQYVLDVCDEEGVLLVVQNHLTVADSGRTSEQFWASVADPWRRYVRLSRNHPSVVIWAVSNEGTFVGGMPRPDAPSVPFLKQMIDQTRKLDSTRPITSSHDYHMASVHGASDLFDAYPCWGFQMDNLFPRCIRQWTSYYFRPAEVYKKDRPWMNDEWAEMCSHHSSATLLGDLAYIHVDRAGDTRSYWGRLGQAWYTYIGMIEQRQQPHLCGILLFGDRMSIFDSEEQPGVAACAGNGMSATVRDRAQLALAPAVVTPKQWSGGALAGRPYRRELVIMNDHFHPLQGEVRWSLADARGQTLASGQIPFALDAVEHQDVVLHFPMPASDRPRTWLLRLEMVDGQGRTLYQDEHELGVVPPVDLATVPPVVLWPAAGTLASCPAGLRCRVATELPSDPGTVVVVPRGAKLEASQWTELESLVAAGGRALVLADSDLPDGFGGTSIRSSGKATAVAHVRCPEHPIVKELPPAALRYWVGAGGEFFSPAADLNVPEIVVAQNALRRRAKAGRSGWGRPNAARCADHGALERSGAADCQRRRGGRMAVAVRAGRSVQALRPAGWHAAAA